MDKKHHIASEKRSFEEIMGAVATRKKWTELVLSRLRSITTIPDHARILDVGAGGGEFLIACSQLGYRCEGIEPWEKARLNAKKLGEHLGIPVHIVDGTAESIPYDENVFDVVHAAQVIEHVVDVD